MLLIGARIQEYRKKAGLSQEELAEKIEVSRQAVSKWERDKAYPDLDRLVCICELLGVSAEELLYGKEENEQSTEKTEGTEKAVSSEKPSTVGESPVSPEKTSAGAKDAEDAKDTAGVKDAEGAKDTAGAKDTEGVENITPSIKRHARVHMRNLRGQHRFAGLKILWGILMALCVFSLVVLAVLFGRNEWTDHADKNANARVEKVYGQYTKADLCYYDENGRKVMNTVWLDIPGIRDGDYIQCYTGKENDSLYIKYQPVTLWTAAVITVLWGFLLFLTERELRKKKKEDTLQIILEDAGEKTSNEEI